MSDKPQQATPHKSLIDQVMDSRVAKNEREWACAIEIEKLQARVQELEEKMNITNKHDLIWLERREVKRIKAEGIEEMLEDLAKTQDGRYMMLIPLNRIIDWKNKLEVNNDNS